MIYTGEKCPVCGKNFVEGDDIVVCPVCGTPHHRDCYNLHNACANEGLHAENFEWKPEAKAEEPKAFEEHGKNGCLSELRKRKSGRGAELSLLLGKTL